ncbi:MAG TPA: multidrug ABC transporter ATP-binding protein [Algoriphagus sp.]|jgi:ABC transporter fused permease/ATP-binding protein|uniref:ABC transporter ATP-binding protein n=1 Tax=unclassified Algoriphagus TaxID=2641541 RepID=UPI000C5D14CD|nr:MULTISPECIES: ABC transporter transmembrane domain-containing protein [unclassified Algoriphagus]MAL15763.1 multidrug ABC transporter ATP-binding protein [Algoriphagus sp.]QYH40323.1 ATP-binding cassette domain-containing protein [Algoriphagus sp. NBT04N3]HAS57375.1 multidrug ABC transporter ATP-binding protein [Algoriphagus sp.]HCD86616.1 multidrug ABC transporter ATP-binding protein [Algoriphagus sp.]HCH44974.1 multidrug ABC transporter ATP-binding protein [Algoriphagus sp.]|tara:strand:+ start:11484 stop:13274 length:1791 start_codon:yes stop_codon:yes gene_type:complete
MAKKRGTALEEHEKRKLNKQSFQKLSGIFRFLLPYKWTFIAGLFFLLLSSLTLLTFPFVAGKLIDTAQGEDWIVSDINTIALMLVGILAVQSIFSFFRVWLFALVSERSMRDIRQSLYNRLLRLPMTFFDKRRTGELISRITSDVSLLQDTFSVTLAELFRQVVTLIAGIAFLFFTTPKLTFFMLGTFPILVLVAMVFGRFIRGLSKKTQDELAAANVIVEETLQSISTVKSFVGEAYESSRYSKGLNRVVHVALKTAKFRGAFISFIIFALFGGIVAVMWYGASLVASGEMSIGELVSFVLYTTFIGGSIAGLGDIYSQIQKAIGSSERVLEILDEKVEESSEFRVDNLEGKIEFEQVVFSYPTRPELQVLKDLSFYVNPGEKIALAGHSGAGKSTIIQLLLKFYEVHQGEIKIDGQNLNRWNLEQLRSHIGMVPQEVLLFGGSIRENIAYAKPNASEEEIIMAAKKANAWQFISQFPEGLDTLVGERGVKLSGGQRQRVAIARAILKDPSILILDEATSSLDAESEHLVQEALDELMKGRTTIIIAHRLATIRKVDRIYVLSEGKIVEQGNHLQLLEQEDGFYANLVRLQFAEN